MNKTDENLQSPITGQFKSSPFYIALGAPILTALASIALTALCYRALPETVARDLMQQINPMLLVAGGGGGLAGAVGMVKRGLDITAGKIAAQLPPDVPENINAGTAILNAGKSAAMNEVERATGVKLESDFI